MRFSTVFAARRSLSTLIASKPSTSAKLSPQSPLIPSPIKAAREKTKKGTEVLALTWSNDQVVHYPAVWLRDNCQCPQCYQVSSQSRRRVMRTLDPEIDLPEEIAIDNNDVVVNWPDGHQSRFKPKFFTKFGPNGSSADFCGFNEKSNHQHWNGNHKISKHDFDQIRTSKLALFQWLQELSQKGIALVKNVPANMDGLPSLVGLINQPEFTHYGPYFKVETKVGANNIAYTSSSIGFHIDLPYYEKTPSVQFLHCIKQFTGQGGDNQFVDGFAVAEYMKKNHPYEWKILTSVKVNFRDLGYDEEGKSDFYKIQNIQTFKLNEDGNMQRIYYSNQQRSRILTQDPDQTKALYQALKLFDDLMNSTDFYISYKLADGECVTFDNCRVLHARTGYQVTPDSSRLLQGSYVAWDEIRSRMNVIKFKDEESLPH